MAVIEVCCTGIESAMIAEQSGASRIELCSVLTCGGVTPSYGLVYSVLKNVGLPVKVLVRPREGNFIYGDREIEVMIRDIEILKNMGVSGVVSGVLDESGFIDEAKLRLLVNAAYPLPFTFFRAIDLVDKPEESMEQLITAGCAAVLTSGGKRTVSEGLSTIIQMSESAEGRLEIVAGGGITTDDVHKLKARGVSSFHLSGKRIVNTGPVNEIFDNQYIEVSGKLIEDFVLKSGN